MTALSGRRVLLRSRDPSGAISAVLLMVACSGAQEPAATTGGEGGACAHARGLRHQSAELYAAGKVDRARRTLDAANLACAGEAASSWGLELDTLLELGLVREASTLARQISSSPDASAADAARARAWLAAPPAAQPASGEQLLAAGLLKKAEGDLASAQKLFDRARIALEASADSAMVLEPNRGSWSTSAMSWAPDGKTLLLAAGGVLRSLSTDGYRETARLRTGDASITSVAFSPEGRSLAMGIGEGDAVLWDMEAAREVGRLESDLPGALRTLVFSPDGGLLVGRSWEDARVAAWNVASRQPPLGSRLRQTSQAAPRLELRDPASDFHPTSVALSPRAPLAVAAGGVRVRAWHLPEQTEVTVQAPPAGVDSLVFSADGRFLFGATQRGAVAVWRVAEGGSELKLTLTLELTSTESALALSADGFVQVARLRLAFTFSDTGPRKVTSVTAVRRFSEGRSGEASVRSRPAGQCQGRGDMRMRMGRFDKRVRILLLAGSCASACSIDERSFGGGEPSEGIEGESGTAGEAGAEPPIDGDGDPDNDVTSRESIEGNDVTGLAGGDVMNGNGIGSAEGVGGTSIAGVGGGAGGSTADPTIGSSGGASGSSGTSGETGVGVIANSVDRFFVDWPAGADPLAVGTRAAEIFTSQSLASGSGHDNEDDYKHYKDACAWYGALAIAQLGGQQSLVNALVAKYQPYQGTWAAFNPPTAQNSFVGSLDDSLFGIVPLEIAKLRSDAIYVQEGDLAADHQIAFIAQQLRNSSDDMFHVAALQMQAYRVSTDAADRQRHMDTAAATMVTYLRAMQKNNGLIPHHLNQPGFDVSWSRGNGWFAAGLAELMREIPSTHPDYVTIESGYRRMMNGLLQYQVPAGQPGAGLWNQVVDSRDPRNSVETSGSAMFAYALITGVRQGLLDVETYGPAARAAWLGLVQQLNASGQIQNVSDWLYLPESHGYPANQYAGDEENYYFERGRLTGDNHGQSPLMWSAAALVRPLE